MIINSMTQEEYQSLIRSQNTSKYHSKKAEMDGHQFDSEKEAERYSILKLLQNIGEIYDLELQKEFELIPTQRDENGKLLERKCSYRADFCYKTKSGKLVVEDTKGVRTKEYIIKRKLMLHIHGIHIKEI